MELELNRKMKAVTMFVVFIFATALTTHALDEYALNYHEQSFDSNVTVLNETEAERTSLGVDVGQELGYGNLPQETNATKFMEINSSQKVILNIASTGNMSKNLYYEDRQYFEGYNRIDIEYRAKEPGNYTGGIHLEIVTSDNKVGDYWIRYRGDYWPFSHVAENARDRLDLVLYRLGV